MDVIVKAHKMAYGTKYYAEGDTITMDDCPATRALIKIGRVALKAKKKTTKKSVEKKAVESKSEDSKLERRDMRAKD